MKKQTTTVGAKRAVVVIQDGRVVRCYASVKDFYDGEKLTCNIATVSKRLHNHVDGWLDDDCIARFAADAEIAGRPLAVSKVRPKPKPTERELIERELEEARRKIDDIIAARDRGDVTFAESNADLGWLQNHVCMLETRLKPKKTPHLKQF